MATIRDKVRGFRAAMDYLSYGKAETMVRDNPDLEIPTRPPASREEIGLTEQLAQALERGDDLSEIKRRIGERVVELVREVDGALIELVFAFDALGLPYPRDEIREMRGRFNRAMEEA